MPDIKIIILLAKYIIATALIIAIIMYPAWLARQTDKNKQNMIIVRLGSWLFLLTGVGWFVALFFAIRK